MPLTESVNSDNCTTIPDAIVLLYHAITYVQCNARCYGVSDRLDSLYHLSRIKNQLVREWLDPFAGNPHEADESLL